MIKQFVVIPLFLILVSGYASGLTSPDSIVHIKPDLSLNQKEKWDLMVGKWYGEQPTKEGSRSQWIVERDNNGTYKITFRFYQKDGTFSESTEVGQWAVSGSVYMSMFRGYLINDKIELVDPSDPYNYDAYKILDLNATTFKYESFEYNSTYTIKKVDNDFVFPE